MAATTLTATAAAFTAPNVATDAQVLGMVADVVCLSERRRATSSGAASQPFGLGPPPLARLQGLLTLTGGVAAVHTGAVFAVAAVTHQPTAAAAARLRHPGALLRYVTLATQGLTSTGLQAAFVSTPGANFSSAASPVGPGGARAIGAIVVALTMAAALGVPMWVQRTHGRTHFRYADYPDAATPRNALLAAIAARGLWSPANDASDDAAVKHASYVVFWRFSAAIRSVVPERLGAVALSPVRALLLSLIAALPATAGCEWRLYVMAAVAGGSGILTLALAPPPPAWN